MKRITGRYIQQLEGYKAFIPEHLPLTPAIEFDDEMHGLLSKADRALGRLDGSIQTLPNPDLFVLMYVRKEASLSSEIEGTQATLRNVLEAEAGLHIQRRPDDTDEIINYINALNHGLKRLEELPLSLRLIREIHLTLMQGVRGQHATPGEFRTSQNWTGPEGRTLKSALFVPPAPSELSQLLSNFENYIHADDQIPTLVKIGILHAHFETLHPFLDGNGRVGRLLITFLLCANEVLIKPVLYLSNYLKKHRGRYYELLQMTRDKGEYEEWLKFFLLGVTEVANESTEVSRQIVQLRESHRQMIIDNLGKGTANGLRLLEFLYQKPMVNVSIIAKQLELTNPTANKLTDKLAELNIVSEVTGNRRNRIYIYEPYLSIFDE